ncbi:hypothetical protein QCA50_002675 [Cerrena zonata]|uniref:Enoyl reductase (ER) domain-containing protein n=1 Tax=Cerrena zonata TaxID=2478898 RepID=A0AAW0GPX4_9APHY
MVNWQKVTVPWKDPEQGEIVVKVLACGVCGSDHFVQEQTIPTGLPRVPGHEIIGTVAAIHPTETVYKLGDRVGSGWHGGHCFECDMCLEGNFSQCRKQTVNGIRRDGGYAEYVNLRRESLCFVPEDLDPAEAAPLLCAGITAFNSIRNMDGISPGDLVAVQGVGGIGHLAIQYAKAMGYKAVAISSSDSKRDLAGRLGASHYIDSSKETPAQALQALGGAKLVVCAAPNEKVISEVLMGLSPNATLLIVALQAASISIPIFPLVKNRISVRGWAVGNVKDTQDCIAFSKQTGIKCLVERFPLEKAQEAYDHCHSAKFRAVIVP